MAPIFYFRLENTKVQNEETDSWSVSGFFSCCRSSLIDSAFPFRRPGGRGSGSRTKRILVAYSRPFFGWMAYLYIEKKKLWVSLLEWTEP